MTPKAARTTTWRARLPVIAVVVACVAGVTAAVTGAANPVSAVQFLLPGHWVYNAALEGVFHIDGATGNVDARANVPGDAGDLVVQGDTSGYVVGSSRITEFGKSSLEVEGSSKATSGEVPVAVETEGGPYLVYRDVGRVARLGKPAYTLSVGGPVGDPVATDDGVVWLPRTSAGLLCQVRSGQRSVSCPVPLPKGHTGSLTMVGDRPMFIDTTGDELYPVEAEGLGGGRELAVDAADDARVADTDVAGRVAILDGNEMHLVDAGTGHAKPVTVTLPDGDYAGPVSTGDVVAVVDRTTNTLTTFGSDGKERSKTELATKEGEPRLTRGDDDRVYVDDETGEHVVVVDKDGEVTDVPITGEDGSETPVPDEQDSGTPPVPPDTGVPASPPPAGPPATTEQPTPPLRENLPPAKDPPPPPPEVPPSPPGAPPAVTATAGDGSAALTWGVPADNRAPITGYTVSWPGGQTTVTAPAANITGLANGTTYVFTVAAVNRVGAGPGVSSNPVTPAAAVVPPGPPTNVVVNYDQGSRSADLNWGAPADLGGGTLAHYLVSGPGVVDQVVTAQTMNFPGIQQTGTLTFTVKAVTQGPAGQLVGAAASTTAEAPVSKITISQGALTEEYCGELDGCAWMHIVLTGFPPGTEVTMKPYSLDSDYSNTGYTTPPIGADGTEDTDQFANAKVGERLYVIGTLPDGTEITSNTITWGTG